MNYEQARLQQGREIWLKIKEASQKFAKAVKRAWEAIKKWFMPFKKTKWFRRWYARYQFYNPKTNNKRRMKGLPFRRRR